MIKISGKIVYVKSEKTEKGRQYKRLQLMTDHGGTAPASLENVTDMSNSDWVFGAMIELPVSLQVYQGKNGLGYGFTYWGGLGSTATGADVSGTPHGGEEKKGSKYA